MKVFCVGLKNNLICHPESILNQVQYDMVQDDNTPPIYFMKILNKLDVELLVDMQNDGKTLVFPTETSYGLGCDATNQEAVNKIYKIKQRDKHKPFLVVVPTIEMAKRYLEWNDLLDQLAIQYWPGPLTVIGIAKLNSGLANGVITEDNTVALRVTNNLIAKELSEKLNKPIVATSANISDTDKVYNGGSAENIFLDGNIQPDVILDFGPLPITKPTTLIDISGGEVKILRQGELEVNNNL